MHLGTQVPTPVAAHAFSGAAWLADCFVPCDDVHDRTASGAPETRSVDLKRDNETGRCLIRGSGHGRSGNAPNGLLLREFRAVGADALMLFDGWYGLVRVFIAGLIGYPALVLILRASGKRTLSKMNAFDLVVTVALGSTLATVLLSKQVAILEGVLAFALLVGFQFVITWLSVRSEWVQRIVKSQPSLLYYRGHFQHEALRRERLTTNEIRATLREQGYCGLAQVEAVILETAGELSVLSKRDDGRCDTLCDVQGIEGGIGAPSGKPDAETRTPTR